MSAHTQSGRMTVPDFVKLCFAPDPVVMITAYDMTSAMIAEEGGVDSILVGDSLASVLRGESDTRDVSVEEMIYHTKLVVRNTSKPLILADMPYGEFQLSVEAACRAGVRIWKETRCGAIKVESSRYTAEHVDALVHKCEIPILGHVGLRPQAAGILGGFKAQGKTMLVRQNIIKDAIAMEQAGCFGLVVEGVDLSLAREILEKVSIPLIGIGAAPECHGQVLVFHDVVGLTRGPKPKFVRRFGNAAEEMLGSVKRFVGAVRSGEFPNEASECYKLSIEPERASGERGKPLLYGANGKPLV